jgi:hypothetical protein
MPFVMWVSFCERPMNEFSQLASFPSLLKVCLMNKQCLFQVPKHLQSEDEARNVKTAYRSGLELYPPGGPADRQFPLACALVFLRIKRDIENYYVL